MLAHSRLMERVDIACCRATHDNGNGSACQTQQQEQIQWNQAIRRSKVHDAARGCWRIKKTTSTAPIHMCLIHKPDLPDKRNGCCHIPGHQASKDNQPYTRPFDIPQNCGDLIDIDRAVVRESHPTVTAPHRYSMGSCSSSSYHCSPKE